MTDAEFLDYCETHSHTPRCGFVPAHLARLCRLAGDAAAAEYWDRLPNQEVLGTDRYEIREMAVKARARLAGEPGR